MSYRGQALKDISIAIGMILLEEDYKDFRKSCATYEAYAQELDWCETVEDYLEWEEDCNEKLKKAQDKEDSTLVKWLEELMYMEKEEVGELFL